VTAFEERREEYRRGGLAEDDVDADPYVQFRHWYDEAVAAGIPEPNGMVLSTADIDGHPSSRTVLLRGLDEPGFVFFTNRTSRKGRELAANAACALLFPWLALERQVVLRGRAGPVADEVSDAYFASRPRGSQLAASISEQSAVLSGRPELEDRLAELEARYDGAAVPRPPHWGGYVVRPDTIELWQGRPHRLHDRLRYRRADDGWAIERLWP